jgi:hypothetical protein
MSALPAASSPPIAMAMRDVQKHEVQVERKSSQELLHELHNKLLELKVDGYLDSIDLPALPMRKNDGHG